MNAEQVVKQKQEKVEHYAKLIAEAASQAIKGDATPKKKSELPMVAEGFLIAAEQFQRAVIEHLMATKGDTAGINDDELKEVALKFAGVFASDDKPPLIHALAASMYAVNIFGSILDNALEEAVQAKNQTAAGEQNGNGSGN